MPRGNYVLDFDASTDVFKAQEVLECRRCIDGNMMKDYAFFRTQAEVEAHCRKLVDYVDKDGGNILKGETPKEAKPENIRVMMSAAKACGHSLRS
jgi:uroporphyrinogen-III decarboxylase